MKTAAAIVVFAVRTAWRLAAIAARGFLLLCLLAVAAGVGEEPQ